MITNGARSGVYGKASRQQHPNGNTVLGVTGGFCLFSSANVLLLGRRHHRIWAIAFAISTALQVAVLAALGLSGLSMLKGGVLSAAITCGGLAIVQSLYGRLDS